MRFNSVAPEELKQKLDNKEGLFILDVRETSEYGDWHVPGSVNIPLGQMSRRMEEIPKENEIITICAHGFRSAKAASFLSASGYRARSMVGGMVAWNHVYDFAELPLLGCGENDLVLQLRRMGKGCLSYLVISGKEAVAIDASIDTKIYTEQAAAKGARLIGAIDTHTHADHISGGRRLADSVSGFYLTPDNNIRVEHGPVSPDSPITFGDMAINPISTPGHTPEHVTYLLGELAFTGDTLFVDAIGRPDLGHDPASNTAILWESIHNKLLRLHGKTRIVPAHHGRNIQLLKNVPVSASIEEIKENLGSLRMGKEKFVEWICSGQAPKPFNFQIIKRLNQGMEKIDEAKLLDLEAGANRCAAGQNI
jgi:glyoxylase-like metal-dependent hydrolase (beta-lactamase superfamily II)/rhodanese-related sulfurtransferase